MANKIDPRALSPSVQTALMGAEMLDIPGALTRRATGTKDTGLMSMLMEPGLIAGGLAGMEAGPDLSDAEQDAYQEWLLQQQWRDDLEKRMGRPSNPYRPRSVDDLPF